MENKGLLQSARTLVHHLLSTATIALGDDKPYGYPGEHRQFEDDSDRAHANWFEYMLVVVLASLLLLGSLTLVVFWVMYYGDGFAWTENPKLQFNLHPVLMVAGFISFSGFYGSKLFWNDFQTFLLIMGGGDIWYTSRLG